ncbi:hypothetical protein TYRP_020978, partial [Tyrophagus putrescentiae]
HTFVHYVLHGLNHNPNETILTKYFDHILDIPKFKKCFIETTMENDRQFIFEQPLGFFIHNFLHSYNFTHRHGHSDDAVTTQIKNVLSNLKTIVNNVYRCVHDNSTSFKSTKLSFTKFSLMSPEKISAIYQQPLVFPEKKKAALGSSGAAAVLGSSGGSSDLQIDFVITDDDLAKEYPSGYDYRDFSYVSPIKNQGECGFCFAFSLVAAMESAYMIQYGETGISFSEIDLIDCMVAHNTYTPSRKNSHIDCSNGGPPDKFLDEASTVGLIPNIYGRDHALFYSDTEDYLFNPERCGTNPIQAKLTQYAYMSDIKDSDEQLLKAILIKYGPVTVNMRTDLLGDEGRNQQFFKITDKMHIPCNANESPTHMVTVIGWDEEYWIIKNSYGNNPPGPSDESLPDYLKPWGVEGYLYLQKELANDCAIFGTSISAKQLNENQPLLKMNVEVLNPIPQIKSSFEELIKESVKQVLARLPLSSISWAAFSNTKKSDNKPNQSKLPHCPFAMYGGSSTCSRRSFDCSTLSPALPLAILRHPAKYVGHNSSM